MARDAGDQDRPMTRPTMLSKVDHLSSHITVACRPTDDVTAAIAQQAGPLPQIELTYEAPIKTLWLTIRPEPKPVMTFELLSSINKVQRAVHALWGPDRYALSPVRFLAYRAKGPIVTLGGDLEFYLDCIAKNDRTRLQEYTRLSTEGVIWNASSLNGTAITLATAHAKALGGGIDAPRSCNIMIAERQATFSYPEIKFNHFPITAVAVLSRCAGASTAHKILSSGAEYSAEQFAQLGALDGVAEDGEGENWLRQYACDALRSHAARLDLFYAFYHQGEAAFKAELAFLAKRWIDCMMRLTPAEISHLQRLNAAQDKILLHLFRAKAPAN